jgi:hypothetical protein
MGNHKPRYHRGLGIRGVSHKKVKRGYMAEWRNLEDGSRKSAFFSYANVRTREQALALAVATRRSHDREARCYTALGVKQVQNPFDVIEALLALAEAK